MTVLQVQNLSDARRPEAKHIGLCVALSGEHVWILDVMLSIYFMSYSCGRDITTDKVQLS